MKLWFSVLLTLLLCGVIAAQQHHAHSQAKPATLMSGLGDLHHPVSTEQPQAQQFFDQGFLIYAFNHEEAARSFHRAAEVDPTLAIAYWGVAEAVGPNYKRSRQRRPLCRGTPCHPESGGALGPRFAGGASLHSGHGAAVPGGSQSRSQAGGRGLSRCHARSGDEISR